VKSVEKNYVFSQEITDAICGAIVFESIDWLILTVGKSFNGYINFWYKVDYYCIMKFVWQIVGLSCNKLYVIIHRLELECIVGMPTVIFFQFCPNLWIRPIQHSMFTEQFINLPLTHSVICLSVDRTRLRFCCQSGDKTRKATWYGLLLFENA